ncbi:hypothetical protein K440DRAFT_663688 [Wilcoxina mikolae CBS 423.85]|nr:hypothetical protein K440DRAFT_663688 [Wilcoxina mikolae CBS 423.85]
MGLRPHSPGQKYTPNLFVRFLGLFGYYDTFALPIGALGIIVAMSVLTSLWEFGNRNTIDARVGIWSQLVVDGWATRTATVSCAILRVCLAAQSFTCSCMLATLALEYGQGSRAKDVELMAMYRRANAGPNDILFLLLKGLNFKRTQIQLTVVALMALCILVSQMFSTILISDMGDVIIRSRNVSQMVHYHKERGSPFWSNLETSPSEYPLFAEKVITMPVVVEGNKTSPGISDSGIVLRAFFPLKSQDRQSMGFYRGPVSLAELHYLCFPPDLSYNISSYKTPKHTPPPVSFEPGSFYSPPVANSDDPREATLAGRLGFPSQLHEVTPILARSSFDLRYIVNWTSDAWRFRCTLRFGTITTCAIDGELVPDTKAMDRKPPNYFTTQWKLVFDTQFARTKKASRVVYDGEWATSAITFTDETGANGITVPIKYSLCVGRSDSARSDVVAEAPGNITEPVLGQIQVNGTINTTAIQNQLGVSQRQKQDLEGRGIFNLNRSDARTEPMGSYGPLQYWNAFHWCLNVPNDINAGFQSRCGVSGDSDGNVQGRLNPVFDSLFINTLLETGRLVFAIQAVQTVLFSSAYYRNLFSYDVEGQATMRRFISAQVPVRWRGLIVVGSFVALHFVLLISTIWLYVRSQSIDLGSYRELRSSRKRQKQYWQQR